MFKNYFIFFLTVLFTFYFDLNTCRFYHLHYSFELKNDKNSFLFLQWKPEKNKNLENFRGKFQKRKLQFFSEFPTNTDDKKENKFMLTPIHLSHRSSSCYGMSVHEENAINKRKWKKKITLLANWKCYLPKETAYHLIDQWTQLDFSDRIDLIVSPNLLHIPYLHKKIEENNSKIKICCQDVSVVNGSGPFTGETTADTFSDFLGSIKKKYTLIGHSERKHGFLKNPETDEQTTAKIFNALHADLDIILCIGNDISYKNYDSNFSRLANLLSMIKQKISYIHWKRMMFAFEPSFAIGTGTSAPYEFLNDCCTFVKQWLAKETDQKTSECVPILYGGSVCKSNIKNYLHNTAIDGFLVGKASISESFVDIINMLNEMY